MIYTGLGKNCCALGRFWPSFPICSTGQFIVFANIQICWDLGTCLALKSTSVPLGDCSCNLVLAFTCKPTKDLSRQKLPRVKVIIKTDHRQTFKCHTYECCSLASICICVCVYMQYLVCSVYVRAHLYIYICIYIPWFCPLQ